MRLLSTALQPQGWDSSFSFYTIELKVYFSTLILSYCGLGCIKLESSFFFPFYFFNFLFIYLFFFYFLSLPILLNVVRYCSECFKLYYINQSDSDLSKWRTALICPSETILPSISSIFSQLITPKFICSCPVVN